MKRIEFMDPRKLDDIKIDESQSAARVLKEEDEAADKVADDTTLRCNLEIM
jgi:hypothetical protein